MLPAELSEEQRRAWLHKELAVLVERDRRLARQAVRRRLQLLEQRKYELLCRYAERNTAAALCRLRAFLAQEICQESAV